MRLMLKMALVVAAVMGVGILTSPTHEIVPGAAAAIPEPSSMLLMGAGLGIAALYRKVRNHK